jgi:hypothetical protein
MTGEARDGFLTALQITLGAPLPRFPMKVVALMDSVHLSLMKGAHADLSSTAWQEIGGQAVLWLERETAALDGICLLLVAKPRDLLFSVSASEA